MKKSALKEFIRSQIITELNIEDETKALEDYETKLDAVINKKKEAGLTEEEEGPTKSDIEKTQGLAKTKEELARVEKEMKSVAKKWSKAKGEEKETLLNTLKNKTKIKKELVKLLDKV